MESAGILEALHSFSRDLRLRCIRSFFQVHLILHVRRTVISPYFVNASGDEMRKREVVGIASVDFKCIRKGGVEIARVQLRESQHCERIGVLRSRSKFQ